MNIFGFLPYHRLGPELPMGSGPWFDIQPFLDVGDESTRKCHLVSVGTEAIFIPSKWAEREGIHHKSGEKV
ncbi:MAG: hypothetical protein EBT13_07020 [Rhodobacteraceae bacterium]|nr:hypothetical protein [Paracoccaceae bacterium]